MTDSSAGLSEMTRAELEEYIDGLESRVETLESTVEDVRSSSGRGRASIQKRISGIEDELDELQTAVGSHGEQLEAVADVGEEKTGKGEKVAAIAAFAMQKVDGGQTKTTVEASEIRGCVGVSRRYAYDLIDAIGDDSQHEWATVRDEQTVTTGSGTARKKKALKVDCDRLRESSHSPESVNKFTTRSHEEGR